MMKREKGEKGERVRDGTLFVQVHGNDDTGRHVQAIGQRRE
jgi:hypothetical protein